MNVHFSSKHNEWPSPQDLYNELNKKYHFTLDPCASHDNAKCALYFTESENGLYQTWAPHRVFMNPPYGRKIGAWMEKAYIESKLGAIVVCLVPARTDTKWWHDYAMKGDIQFLKGRLKFGDSKNSAPFPSAIVIFKPNNLFIRILQKLMTHLRNNNA